jgi:hypothetical protein
LSLYIRLARYRRPSLFFAIVSAVGNSILHLPPLTPFPHPSPSGIFGRKGKRRAGRA